MRWDSVKRSHIFFYLDRVLKLENLPRSDPIIISSGYSRCVFAVYKSSAPNVFRNLVSAFAKSERRFCCIYVPLSVYRRCFSTTIMATVVDIDRCVFIIGFVSRSAHTSGVRTRYTGVWYILYIIS